MTQYSFYTIFTKGRNDRFRGQSGVPLGGALRLGDSTGALWDAGDALTADGGR